MNPVAARGSLPRAILFNVLYFGATAVMAIAYIPLAALSRDGLVAGVAAWGRVTLALLRAVVGLEVEVRGRERLPDGPVLIAAKHQSALETILVVDLLGDPAVVLKRELLSIPVWGWLARRARHVAIDRSAGAAALRRMLDDARAALAEGRPVVIFPQGTRVAPRALGSGTAPRYQPGVAALYAGLGVPVAPVALNTGLFWGRRAFMKYPGRAVIEFLPPIPPGLAKREFLARLETEIEAATDRLEAEAMGDCRLGDAA